MEGGLSNRALRVLRAVLHKKANMDLAAMLDPALVAEQISLVDLACERACGPVTLSGYGIGCKVMATNYATLSRPPIDTR